MFNGHPIREARIIVVEKHYSGINRLQRSRTFRVKILLFNMDATRPNKPLRIAHITDCHLYDNPRIVGIMQKVFSYLKTINPRPDLIINTGDTVFDANFQPLEVVTEGWNLW